MNCKCISEIDAQLKEHNLSLHCVALAMPNLTTRITLKTGWIDKSKVSRSKIKFPPAMWASHCPFCGIKIEKEEEVKPDPSVIAPTFECQPQGM